MQMRRSLPPSESLRTVRRSRPVPARPFREQRRMRRRSRSRGNGRSIGGALHAVPPSCGPGRPHRRRLPPVPGISVDEGSAVPYTRCVHPDIQTLSGGAKHDPNFLVGAETGACRCRPRRDSRLRRRARRYASHGGGGQDRRHSLVQRHGGWHQGTGRGARLGCVDGWARRAPDPALQVRAVEDLIAQGVAAIGVVPNDAEVLEPVLAKAREQGNPRHHARVSGPAERGLELRARRRRRASARAHAKLPRRKDGRRGRVRSLRGGR